MCADDVGPLFSGSSLSWRPVQLAGHRTGYGTAVVSCRLVPWEFMPAWSVSFCREVYLRGYRASLIYLRWIRSQPGVSPLARSERSYRHLQGGEIWRISARAERTVCSLCNPDVKRAYLRACGANTITSLDRWTKSGGPPRLRSERCRSCDFRAPHSGWISAGAERTVPYIAPLPNLSGWISARAERVLFSAVGADRDEGCISAPAERTRCTRDGGVSGEVYLRTRGANVASEDRGNDGGGVSPHPRSEPLLDVQLIDRRRCISAPAERTHRHGHRRQRQGVYLRTRGANGGSPAVRGWFTSFCLLYPCFRPLIEYKFLLIATRSYPHCYFQQRLERRTRPTEGCWCP